MSGPHDIKVEPIRAMLQEFLNHYPGMVSINKVDHFWSNFNIQNQHKFEVKFWTKKSSCYLNLMENGPNWKLVVKVLYKVKFDDIFYEASTHHINIASPITVGKLARALARLAPRMRGK